MAHQPDIKGRFVLATALLSAATLFLLTFRVLLSGTTRYWFIPENLALAWVALFFAWLLCRNLVNQRWLSWQNLLLTTLWLVFLPNTWYVLTDFVHIQPTGEVSQMFDIVLMSLLVFTGFSLGIASLFLVHHQLIKRVGGLKSYGLIELAILASSFAVYLGRDLRWNSWDVIKNPGGVLVNVSDRIIDPFGSPRALNITLLFFLMVSVVYGAFWIFAQPASKTSR
ncbi:DUF1361 domain-containing protein [Candidatus Saccharibacteria bacterium]|nr:DUF1361 domain-containing protein [Candidatus Saccharibacteria bacterium]